jgi:hypothetical protein
LVTCWMNGRSAFFASARYMYQVPDVTSAAER